MLSLAELWRQVGSFKQVSSHAPATGSERAQLIPCTDNLCLKVVAKA